MIIHPHKIATGMHAVIFEVCLLPNEEQSSQRPSFTKELVMSGVCRSGWAGDVILSYIKAKYLQD